MRQWRTTMQIYFVLATLTSRRHYLGRAFISAMIVLYYIIRRLRFFIRNFLRLTEFQFLLLSLLLTITVLTYLFLIWVLLLEFRALEFLGILFDVLKVLLPLLIIILKHYITINNICHIITFQPTVIILNILGI